MPGKEGQPGVIEKGSKILRNAEATVAVIAAFFGAYGVAAIAAIGAVIDHATAKFLEKKRTGKL